LRRRGNWKRWQFDQDENQRKLVPGMMSPLMSPDRFKPFRAGPGFLTLKKMKTLDRVKPVANELNEASHTPGPWECSPLRGRWGYAVTKDGKRICDVQNVPNVNTENQSMNAALIASAPELLYALESACGCIEASLDDVPSDAREAMENDLNVYRAAIAKAKGDIYTPVF
jgi:hypothetical protein